jgi:cation transport regulator
MNPQQKRNRRELGDTLQHGGAQYSGRLPNLERRERMPYSSTADLPASVRDKLPAHAQEIYKEAFNSAYDEYAGRGADGREETAHKVAWSAVKKKYRKDEASGKWEQV